LLRTRLFRSEDGGVLAEFALISPLYILVVLGIMEFMVAFFQWNAAAKAVQLGARLAAVSNPVAAVLPSLAGQAGGTMPAYDVTCDGRAQSCSLGAYDAAAMNNLVFGRGRSSCAGGSLFDFGMCSFLSQIRPEHVRISYESTGLGFAGRPGGPVPTITIELQNLTFEPLLMNVPWVNGIPFPRLTTTVTGEDLSSGTPAF